MSKKAKLVIVILTAVCAAALLAVGLAMIITGSAGNKRVPRMYSIACTASVGASVQAPPLAAAGEKVSLTVRLEEGYALHAIEADGQSLSSSTFIMPARDIEVYVEASKGSYYAVTAEACVGGSILPASERAQEGSVVAAEIRADEGYRLRRVFANGSEVPFAEEEDFVYRARAAMQGGPLVFSAEFAENPTLGAKEGYVLDASYSQAREGTAISYWQTEYREEGIFLRVLVRDGTVVQNGRLEAEQRDHIEFYLCPESSLRTLYGANALHCLVTADGTFFLRKCLADGTLGESGKDIDYGYGTTFTAERILCTLSKNNFDGYAVEVFLGYGLFGGVKGNYVYAPALYNCIGTDGGKTSYGSAYAASWTEGTMGSLLAGGVSETDPSTYLPIGGKTRPSAYSHADVLLLGDGLFSSPRFGTFEKTAAGNVRRAAFEGLLSSDFTDEALSALGELAPAALVLSFGRADMEGGASAYTAADRVVRTLTKIKEAVPGAKLVWCALPPDAEGDSEPEAYETFNSIVAVYAAGADITVADPVSSLKKEGLAPYVYEDGALTAEGCDRYIAEIAKALDLTYLPALLGTGVSSAGWKAEGDDLSAHYADGGKQIAWVKDGATRLSAAFSSEGGRTACFGLVFTDGENRLYFFVREQYEAGVLTARSLCYELREGGVLTASKEIPMSKNGNMGLEISLTIERTGGGISLSAGSYLAFKLDEDVFGAASVNAGVFAEDALVTVHDRSAEVVS